MYPIGGFTENSDYDITVSYQFSAASGAWRICSGRITPNSCGHGFRYTRKWQTVRKTRIRHGWFWLGALMVALPALAIYARTLEPSVYFVDSGGFLATIKVFGVDYAPGFPLYILLAIVWTRLIGLVPGLFTFTQSVNYFSGLAAAGMAVAIYAATFELLSVECVVSAAEPVNGGRSENLASPRDGRKARRPPRSSKARHDVVSPLERRPIPSVCRPVGNERRWLAWSAAIFAGLLTAFAYTIWSQAITAAPYTFEGMFSAVMLYLAVGLVPFFLLLIYRYRVLWRNRRFMCIAVGTFFLFGALPYVYEPIRSAAWPVLDWGHPANLHNLILQLTGATWTSRPSNFRIFDPITLGPAVGHWATLTFYQFVPVTLVLTLFGWWFIRRWYRPLFVPLLLFYVGSIVVPVTYVTNNDESYLIPAHIVLAVASAVGLVGGIDALGSGWTRRGHGTFDGRVALAVASGVATILIVGTVATNYPELDRHNNYVVEDYAKNALRGVPKNGIILVQGDELNAAILYLQVVRDYRPDVTAISESIVHFGWWRESFRHNNPNFYLPEIPLDRVSTDAQWLSDLTDELIKHNPGRTVYVLTVAGRQIPNGYALVPAGIGYRLVSKTDTAGLKIRPSDWSFPPSTLDEVLGRPHYLQTAYNIFLHEIQLAYMQAFQNLGDDDFAEGRYAAAAKDYATGLRFAPNQAELRLGEGASLAKTGEVPGALSYLSSADRPVNANGGTPDAAQLTAAFGRAFNAVGNQMYGQAQASRAFEDYRLAYQLDPTDPEIIANWGAALALQNDQPQAFMVLRRGIQIAPNSAKLYFNLAQVDQAMHNQLQSQKMFARAFALDPQLKKLLQK